MLKYKNISTTKKTFYGVSFIPGDVKEVPGYINAAGMVRVTNKLSQSTATNITKKRSYNKRSVTSTSESAIEDQTPTLTKETLNFIKEDMPNG